MIKHLPYFICVQNESPCKKKKNFLIFFSCLTMMVKPSKVWGLYYILEKNINYPIHIVLKVITIKDIVKIYLYREEPIARQHRIRVCLFVFNSRPSVRLYELDSRKSQTWGWVKEACIKI